DARQRTERSTHNYRCGLTSNDPQLSLRAEPATQYRHNGKDTLARRRVEYTGRYDPDPQRRQQPMCVRCEKQPLYDGISGLCLMCIRSDKRKREMQLCGRDGVTAAQRRAGIPDHYARASLADLESETQRELRENPRGWYCYGSVGVGKTHMLAAWANDLLARGMEVVWIGFEAMLGACRASYANGPGGQEMMIGHFCAAQHLCLDELSPAATAYARETFCRILDTRLTHNMPTFIATNLEPAELDAAFDARIASRLATLTPLAVNGPDRRRL
ncbi:MAG: ATP-binding protein, partial [Sedimentisphaerales bacterium]|nr:ATP-binding protein [Sedimentisphaerales bacterium]